MKTTTDIDKIAAALVKVQATAGPALKQSVNPAFRSKYADLAAVWEAVRDPLTQAGIAVLQEATLSEAGVSVTTRLLHLSGQWIETEPLTVPLTKKDAHGVGSAVSYGKRYGLSAALGVVADDDDGNRAVGHPAATVEPSRPKPPAGWADFMHTIEVAADKGMAAMVEAFKAGAAPLREYAQKHESEWLDDCKQHAKSVEVKK